MPARGTSAAQVLEILYREATPFVRHRLAVVLGLVICAAVLTALGPIALKQIIDGFTGAARGAVVLLVVLYALSQWLARAAGELRGLVYGRIERRLFRTLSERLFAHLLNLPLRFHLDRQTGAVTETLTNGLEGLQTILHHLVFTLLPVTVELATVIVVLWRLAPPLFLGLFCAALLCYAAVFGYSAVTLAATARLAADARVQAGAALTDGLLNYETVKYFAAEPALRERVGQAMARSEREWIAFYRRFAGNGLLVASVFAAFLAATTWCATVDVRDGRMSIGDFVLVNTYMLQLARPVETLGYAAQGFSQGLALLEKMLGLFRETPEPAAQSRCGAAAGPGALAFDQVSLSYRSGCPVLRDISFRLEARRTLAVVGSSGSGKSTLVRLLVRLVEPDGGRILLDDVPIAHLSLAQLRRAIAVVPQDTVLFNDSLAYNIALGRTSATLADVQRAARIAHLHDFIMSLPDGYETRVGERGVKLSGGERQRVSIARAVLTSPILYVFDEATASLDSRTEQDILASLREISEHRSTLVIAHRLSTVVHADEIVVLDGGRIVERGTHPSLLRQNGAYAAAWRAQQQGPAAT